MSKLIPLEEAASILGMSVEQITELRSNHEIFGYRDGQNWKFKMTELERVAGEMDIKLNISGAAKVADDLSESFGFNLDDSTDDLILADDSSSGAVAGVEELDPAEFAEDSSVELFQNPLKEELQVAADSNSINLDDDLDEIDLQDSGLLQKGTAKNLDLASDSGALKLEDSGELLSSDENVLEGDEELSFGSSSLSLASESSKLLADAGGTGSDLLDEVVAKPPSGSDTGKMLAGGGDDDELTLAGDDDLFSEELSLADSGSFEDSVDLSSDFEDSAELVLDDSDSNSEIMLEESGIDLSANESGIAVGDEPLELGGSDIDALELPEDDDDMIVLEDAADPDNPTMMQEDDFNLTPLEASLEEDESSGSQVIALEDSEIYADDDSATILGEADPGGCSCRAGRTSRSTLHRLASHQFGTGYCVADDRRHGCVQLGAEHEILHSVGQNGSKIHTLVEIKVSRVIKSADTIHPRFKNLGYSSNAVGVNSLALRACISSFGL